MLCFGERMISLPSSLSSSYSSSSSFHNFTTYVSFLYSPIVFYFRFLSPSYLRSPLQPALSTKTVTRTRNIFLSRTLSLTPQHTSYNSHPHLTHIHTLHNHGTKEDPNQNYHRRAQPTGNSITPPYSRTLALPLTLS